MSYNYNYIYMSYLQDRFFLFPTGILVYVIVCTQHKGLFIIR